ncbi:uncharacterized protein TNCV_3819701 [Trichonephila clavipes]|nr:uncharacterized protein TNCV_3819701 [Trichonephila clavipes]
MLENDQHWGDALTEASKTLLAPQIQILLTIILTTCALSDPKNLWEKHKESMSEDIFLRAHRQNPDLDVQYSEDIFIESLILLEEMCVSINKKTPNHLGLFSPVCGKDSVVDIDILREKQYDINALQIYVLGSDKALNK